MIMLHSFMVPGYKYYSNSSEESLVIIMYNYDSSLKVHDSTCIYNYEHNNKSYNKGMDQTSSDSLQPDKQQCHQSCHGIYR